MSRLRVRPATAADWPALKSTRLAALLDAPTAFGASHASAAAFSDDDWQQHAVSTPQRTFFLAFDADQAIGLAAQVVAGDGECYLIAMWVAQPNRGSIGRGREAMRRQQRPSSAGARRGAGKSRAAAFYRKQGFVFLPEWEALESHPHIRVQKMAWLAAA